MFRLLQLNELAKIFTQQPHSTHKRDTRATETEAIPQRINTPLAL